MRTHPLVLISLLLPLAAACGDDGGGGGDDDPGVDAAPDEPDAPPAATCAELDAPLMTVSSYPAMVTGNVTGGGADVDVGDGVCAEQGGFYAPEVGEDVVVALTGLTAGASYGVILETDDDLGFYVITGCNEAGTGPGDGQCLTYIDDSVVGERETFTAPADGVAYVVIDNAELDGAPASGAFTLEVVAAECEGLAGCASADEPVCLDYVCEAGASECTGDDAGDTATPPDDGPAAAQAIATPTAGTPTVVTAAVCSQPATEQDWYELTTTAVGSYVIALDWGAAGVDLDVYLIDAEGTVVDGSAQEGDVAEGFQVDDLAAGTYSILVLQYEPTATAAATPYTLTVALPECIGDDTGDTTGAGDDTIEDARDLTGAIGVAQAIEAAVCNVPTTEVDYYEVTVGAGEGAILNLSWTGAADDLDVVVTDADGAQYGVSYWVNPEVVTLTYLPAGTYYVAVSKFASAPQLQATPYTITATRTTAQTCTTTADCASTYSTQFYRGVCDTGVCSFIPDGAGANGAPCDSAGDCTSDTCSYIPFEADAHLSVCTTSCTMTSDCAAVGSGLTCTTGFQTNICVPACETDLECGARIGNGTLDAGQPWNYLTCAVADGTCGP